jgi:hypothetical protein
MIEALGLFPSYKSADDSRAKSEYVQKIDYHSSEYQPDMLTIAYNSGYFKAFKQDYPFNIESPLVVRSKGMESSINPEYVRMGLNYENFISSFEQHDGFSMPKEFVKDFEWMANILSSLPLKDSLVQYSQFDNMIDFLIVLNDGIKLSVGKFTDEDAVDEVVEFSLYDKRVLLLSGEMKLEELVKKIKQIHKTSS